jgi:hypothetical protein
MKILAVILGIALLGSLIFKGLEYVFGADKVFIGALCSIPFLLIWCLLTPPKTEIK